MRLPMGALAPIFTSDQGGARGMLCARRLRWIRSIVPAVLALVGLLIQHPAATAAGAPPDAIGRPLATSSFSAEQSIPLRTLQITPDRGEVGTTFTVSADGLPAGRTVEWHWQTWDGSYSTNPTSETVEYRRRAFVERRDVLGRSTVDDEGRTTATFVAPEDFGEVHSIYAVVDGEDVARGGFRILLAASLSETAGPIGTPITIRVTGMAATMFSGSTLAVRWDNTYTGILTATTTQGTAMGRIRAAGVPGLHFVVLNAGTIPAYLNIGQSPYDFVYAHLPNQEEFRLPFTVTGDAGLPPDVFDWPNPDRVAVLAADAPRTAAVATNLPGVSAELQPSAGSVLAQPMLRASGLAPNAQVDMWWVTARGNRVTPSGWSLADIPLPSARTSPAGTLAVPITVPDDLGGWHVLKLAQDGRIVAEAPFYVERSLVEVSARQVEAGETVTLHLKGIGWTELDNGFAMTYDNAHIGYACGFNSNGDVVIQVLATGAPGTHLIDLYPMVYAGQDAKDWYWAPVLTYADDFPALGLGYRLPAIRIAIEVL